MATANMRTSSLKSALPSPSSGPALTASRSTRRLRGSGSVKGAQSPGLFASVGRRQQGRGSSGFETAEPTSPKVTCIGQVRVKTGRKILRKKKKNKVAALNRPRSRRVSGDLGYGRRAAGVQGGICDAVRAFGSEINCFLLCGAGGGRSSVCCSGTDRDKANAAGGKRMGSSCGAAFARWIMAVHETEEVVGKAELAMDEEGEVLGGDVDSAALVEEEESDEELVEERRFRRGIRALELLADELQKGRDFTKEGFGGGGLVDDPVCAPPKNALLLMRCRADPVKLSALENRFRETKVDVEDEEGDATAAAGGGAVGDDDIGSAKDRGFARRVHEVKGKNQYMIATQPFETGREIEERADDKNSPRETSTDILAQESLAKLGEKIDEEAQGSGRFELPENDKGGSFPVTFSDKSHDAGMEEEDDSLIGEEADEEDNEVEKLVLVESLPAADDLDSEKENKGEVFRFTLPPDKTEAPSQSHPEKPDKKLVRRDLLLASGVVEGRRWSFSKDRESSVDGGGRRHSMSTEMARRSSSFREKKEVTRRSSFSHEATGDLIRRSSSFSSAERNAVGSRGRRSVSKEKDSRRRSVDESAEYAKKSAAVPDSGTTAATGGGRRGGAGIEVQESRLVRGRDILIRTRDGGEEEQGSDKQELPDCLRLMMYEPKLSMEISQETWVCTDDFQRWKPNRRRRGQQQQCRSSSNQPFGEPEQAANAEQEEDGEEAKVVTPAPHSEQGPNAAEEEADADDGHDGKTNLAAASKTADTVVSTPLRPTTTTRPPHIPVQPPSAPPELVAIAKSTDRKLDRATAAIAAAFGPLVLTRCKSEPMRNSPRLLMPEDYCFWKSRHHDHRQAIGAAGVGVGF